MSTGFNQDGGALGIDALLAGEAPFTAVCAANDLLALGAMQRLASLGIEVPGRSRSRGSTTSRPRRWPRPACPRCGSRCTRSVVGRSASRRACSLGESPLARGAPDRARPARIDRAPAGRPGRAARTRHTRGGRLMASARGPGRPHHRQQPRHRRRGGRQGRRRGSDGRRALSPVGGGRQGNPGAGPRRRRRRGDASMPTSPTGGRRNSWSSG